MGLFDSALSMLGGASGDASDPKAAIMQAAMGLLSNHEGGVAGGMQNLISTLQSSGLADHVASWADGNHLPVSGDQIKEALGDNGMLEQLAQTAGLPHDQIAGHWAEMLPGIVQQFGQNGGELGGIASMLGGFLGKK